MEFVVSSPIFFSEVRSEKTSSWSGTCPQAAPLPRLSFSRVRGAFLTGFAMVVQEVSWKCRRSYVKAY